MGTRFKHAKNRKVQYLDEQGKWKSTGCDSLAEAKIWYEKNVSQKCFRLRDIVDDMFTNENIGSFKWVSKKLKKHQKESWWLNSISFINIYIIPFFGDLDIRDITTSLIQDWYFGLTKKSKREELADSTKNKNLNLLSIIFQWSEYKGYVSSNPVEKVLKIKAETKKRDRFTDKELEIMFPEEINAAVEFWGSIKWASFFYVMKDTGWRPGEVAGLDISGYFPGLKGIYTDQSIDSITAKINKSIKTSNNGYNYKVGLLSDFTIKLLNVHIQNEKIRRGLIFTVNGNPIKRNCTRLHYRRCLMRNGIDVTNRPPYAIRTTFMTKMANVYNEDIVKELMGHKQWHTCYDQRTPEELIIKIANKV